MYIRTQDEMAIFDFDRYGFISANEEGEVFMGYESESGFALGKYENRERAKAVVQDIYANLEMSRYDMPYC